MKETQRFIGIDLFRGLAIYAVILLHIDEAVQTMPSTWLRITDFALFSVPFFIATAFYLAFKKIYRFQGIYPLRSRLIRLLIPYTVWSIFYVLYKVTKFMVSGGASRLPELFHDPLSLLFFGGATFHLYFLPLLATGTLLIKLAEFLIAKKVSFKGLMLITFLSVLVYEIVLVSGNGLKLPNNVAFQSLLTIAFPDGNSNPVVRWFLVELFWALRCLPYMMVAMLLAHPMINQPGIVRISRYWVLSLLAFLLLAAFGSFILPKAINEIAVGYTALIAAIALSKNLVDHVLIRSLGNCSFGIYLIHLFFVEVVQSIAARLIPNYVYDAKTVVLLFMGTIVLIISWATTALLLKQKKLSHFLFGG